MTYYAPPEGSYEDSHGYGLMSGALKLELLTASPLGLFGSRWEQLPGEVWVVTVTAFQSSNPPQRGLPEGHVDDSLTRGYCRLGANFWPRFSGGPICSAPGASKRTLPKPASATHVGPVSRSPVRRAATVIRLEAGSVTAVGLLWELRRRRPRLASPRLSLTFQSISPKRSSRLGLLWRANAST